MLLTLLNILNSGRGKHSLEAKGERFCQGASTTEDTNDLLHKYAASLHLQDKLLLHKVYT